MPVVSLTSIHLKENGEPDFLDLLSDEAIDTDIQCEHSVTSQDGQYSYAISLGDWEDFRGLISSIINSGRQVQYLSNGSWQIFNDVSALVDVIKQEHQPLQRRRPEFWTSNRHHRDNSAEESNHNPDPPLPS